MLVSKKKGDGSREQGLAMSIERVVDDLCRPESYSAVYHGSNPHNVPMPSIRDLKEALELLKIIIYPGYFDNIELSPFSIKYTTGSYLERAMRIMTDQIKRGFCFYCSEELSCVDCEKKSLEIADQFLESIPEIRRMLALDALAAFEGDPAAKKIGETIFCYPSITALTNHRIANVLYRLEVPIIPRIISESAHSATGIDIHPGATIGEKFFIDHGTGTVIGETCIIGKNVRIYQGVTLGAKSFPLDSEGNPVKGVPRHPIVEDDVVIYAGATILGRVTIGRGAEIGGNVWVTNDVEPGVRVVQQRASRMRFNNGGGI